eukprot:3275844-Ditylum_brightwellii.AAC.1
MASNLKLKSTTKVQCAKRDDNLCNPNILNMEGHLMTYEQIRATIPSLHITTPSQNQTIDNVQQYSPAEVAAEVISEMMENNI